MTRASDDHGPRRVARLYGEFRGAKLLALARRHAEWETEFEHPPRGVSYILRIGSQTFDKRPDSTWTAKEVHRLARAVAAQVRDAERDWAALQAGTDRARRHFGISVLRLATARARSAAATLNGGLRAALTRPGARALLAMGRVEEAVEMERIHRLAVHALPKRPGRPPKKPDWVMESVVAVYLAAGRTRTHAVQLARAIRAESMPLQRGRK